MNLSAWSFHSWPLPSTCSRPFSDIVWLLLYFCSVLWHLLFGLDLHLDMPFILLDVFFISTWSEFCFEFSLYEQFDSVFFFRRWGRWLVVCFHSVPILYLAFKLDSEFLENVWVSENQFLWDGTLRDFLLLALKDIDLFLIIETEIKHISRKSSMWNKWVVLKIVCQRRKKIRKWLEKLYFEQRLLFTKDNEKILFISRGPTQNSWLSLLMKSCRDCVLLSS